MADDVEDMQARLDQLRDENERVEALAKEHGTIPEDADEHEPSLVDPNPTGRDAPPDQEQDESPGSYRAAGG